jgi:hypothetical protein
MNNNLYNLISSNKFNKIKNILNKDNTIINNEINDSKYLIHYSLQFNKLSKVLLVYTGLINLTYPTPHYISKFAVLAFIST